MADRPPRQSTGPILCAGPTGGEPGRGADGGGELAHVLRGATWAVSWSPVPADVRHITPMIWIERSTNPAVAARQSRTMPPGRVALFIWLIDRGVAENLQDYVRTSDGMLTRIPGPWFDRGIRDVRSQIARFFADFHSAGGRVDYLVLDYETTRTMWAFEEDRRAQIIQAILDDPRADEIREGLKERGMREEDFDRIHDWRSARPRYRLGETDLAEAVKDARPAYIIWNSYMRERMADALNRAIFEPVRANYPKVIASNYNYCDITPEHVVPDGHGHLQYIAGRFGTHGSRSFYGDMGQLAQARMADGTRYGNSPFAVLRWEINRLRAIRRSSQKPFHAWVSYKGYRPSRFKNNAYYEELIYHLALGGTEAFIYWHPSERGRPLTVAHDRDARTLDLCLRQLNEWFDHRQRVSLTLEEVPWDSDLIVSGMRIGDDDVLWRITTPPGIHRVKVRETGEVLELAGNAVGMWHESKAGVTLTFEPIDDP